MECYGIKIQIVRFLMAIFMFQLLTVIIITILLTIITVENLQNNHIK